MFIYSIQNQTKHLQSIFHRLDWDIFLGIFRVTLLNENNGGVLCIGSEKGNCRRTPGGNFFYRTKQIVGQK